jgi:hypothetical protein
MKKTACFFVAIATFTLALSNGFSAPVDSKKVAGTKIPDVLQPLPTSAQYPDLLSSKYSLENLKHHLIPRSQWVPFPHLDDRAAWAKADKATLDAAVKAAEKYLDYTWPGIPATASLAIARSGSRSPFENVSFQRRGVLATLVVAEIAENKGRFLDQIINGVWAICEESWWGSSAHLSRAKEFGGLADVSRPSVDLFVATTSEILAWTDYFLGEKFDAVSPQIRKRIAFEIQRRLLQPASEKYHWWMGQRRGGSAPNNWNPWICSNWLVSALLIEKDEDLRTRHLAHILTILDNFANHYPQDGGCDEGPGYWNAAPGSLFDNLVLLNLATNNAFNYAFDDEKIKNMGRFIYRAQISPGNMVNFADASPHAGVDGLLVYRFAKAIRDPDMAHFGAWYQSNPGVKTGAHFARMFYDLFLLDEFRKAERATPLPVDVWLPDLQVAIARDKKGSTDGFYFAAKGGNNAESHNHNDIGNVIVYHDGNPVLIDIGSGKYIAKTFSAKRYEIWNMRSEYHNTPTVNGVLQEDGSSFYATETAHRADATTSTFSLDIANAYPAQADINHWLRTVTLNRGKGVVIQDKTDLKKAISVTEYLMTPWPAKVTGSGEVTIFVQNKNKKTVPFQVKFSGATVKTEVEKINLDLEGESDLGVKGNWGDNIHRIHFTVAAPQTKEVYTIEVTKK